MLRRQTRQTRRDHHRDAGKHSAQTVREKFSCRSCETITQPPAPFHPIARGRAGPDLLATIMHGKFGEHQPLNRQSERFACEGIDLSVSTLADWVGACTTALSPLVTLIRAHVLAGERIHGDDTTVPVLAKAKTITGRLWAYVRDDHPFGGPAQPAAIFFYSRDRGGEHPRRHLGGYTGILQADAYAGFNELYDPARKPAPVVEAACWAHGRRKLFILADTAKAPVAIEAVRRIDAIFDIERDLNGLEAEQRRALRQVRVAPLVAALESWMRGERNKLSRHADVARAMDYMLKRWGSFTRFLGDGRICLTNNAAERALRGVAIGRKSWLFAGSDRGGERAASMYSLIVTAKLNDVDPRARLADALARIADHPASGCANCCPGTGFDPFGSIARPDYGCANLCLHFEPRGRNASCRRGSVARSGHGNGTGRRLPHCPRNGRPFHRRLYARWHRISQAARCRAQRTRVGPRPAATRRRGARWMDTARLDPDCARRLGLRRPGRRNSARPNRETPARWA